MSTVPGITPAKFFDPFYSIARRRFRLSATDVDRLIALGAHAALDGHTLNITYRCSSGCVEQEQFRFKLGPRSAAEWVNKFNARSAPSRPVVTSL